MKILNGAISILLSLTALYLFFLSNTTTHLWMGLTATLSSIAFMCFSIMEEQKEEIERLRKKLLDWK